MPQSISSPFRRWLLLAALLVGAATLVSVAERRDRRAAAPATGDLRGCARLAGDEARACYRREVGRQLAVVSSVGAPRAVFAAPADSGAVTFAATAAESRPLLCDLHARVGVTDANRPSWVGWAEAAPVS